MQPPPNRRSMAGHGSLKRRPAHTAGGPSLQLARRSMMAPAGMRQPGGATLQRPGGATLQRRRPPSQMPGGRLGGGSFAGGRFDGGSVYDISGTGDSTRDLLNRTATLMSEASTMSLLSSNSSRTLAIGGTNGEGVPTHVYAPISKAVTYVYGLPQFSMLSLTLVVSIYVNLYYEKMGAKLYYLSFFTALARSLDSMTDPLMGWITDNTRSAYGRRKPYIFVGMFGFAAMFLALMSPPEDQSGNSTSLWFGCFYVLFYLFDTIANVPYNALGPELTEDSQARTKIFFFGKLYGGVGTLIGAACPFMVQKLLGVTETEIEYRDAVSGNTLTPDEMAAADANTYDGKWNRVEVEGVPDLTLLRLSFLIIGGLFTGLYIVFQSALLSVVKERPQPERRGMPLVPSILRTFANQAFRPLVIGWTLDAIALSALATSFPFFILYVLEPENPDSVVTTCFLALFIAALVGMPVWSALAKRYGKYRVWCAFNLLNTITNFLFAFVTKGQTYPVIIITFLNGLPLGGSFLTDAILADVIDYDEFLNGSRNEGGFTVFSSFIPKFVSIPAGAIPLGVLAAMGFVPSVDGKAQPQEQGVRNFIRFLFVVVPCTCTFLSFLVKRRYPMKTDAVQEAITAGIDAHKRGEEARDPVTGRLVSLLELTEEEQDQAWLFDNFTKEQLATMLLTTTGAQTQPQRARASMMGVNEAIDVGDDSSGVEQLNTAPVFKSLGVMFGVSCLVLLVLVAIVFAFFKDLEDPVLTLVPTIAVIGAGMMCCFCIITYLRIRALITLTQMKDVNVPLLVKIVEFKDKGQRGGSAAEAAVLLGDFTTAYQELNRYVDEVEAELLDVRQQLLESQSKCAALKQRVREASPKYQDAQQREREREKRKVAKAKAAAAKRAAVEAEAEANGDGGSKRSSRSIRGRRGSDSFSTASPSIREKLTAGISRLRGVSRESSRAPSVNEDPVASAAASAAAAEASAVAQKELHKQRKRRAAAEARAAAAKVDAEQQQQEQQRRASSRRDPKPEPEPEPEPEPAVAAVPEEDDSSSEDFVNRRAGTATGGAAVSDSDTSDETSEASD